MVLLKSSARLISKDGVRARENGMPCERAWRRLRQNELVENYSSRTKPNVSQWEHVSLKQRMAHTKTATPASTASRSARPAAASPLSLVESIESLSAARMVFLICVACSL